jgi:hypothetical protein
VLFRLVRAGVMTGEVEVNSIMDALYCLLVVWFWCSTGHQLQELVINALRVCVCQFVFEIDTSVVIYPAGSDVVSGCSTTVPSHS